ncbi:hypothetical protein [Curtobacterium sp. MCSS17_016]|uniref:hypothetical protein n=1 Tax=Curtobacterium sp. MCSS17_016 TaxID=2175644 RepID=UPI000DA76EE5|nr:hypothetical protein [Curtobacterium sp. MCSS17_016]WIE80875.1 hypothetical protein DEJ19_020375 [Curtobacterium sp. MCSS17_016]
MDQQEPQPLSQHPLTTAVTQAAWSQGWLSRLPSTAANIAEAGLRAQHSVGAASTGTPMSAISGAAFDRALLSNIGRGSLSTGGSGIAGGLDRIASVRSRKATAAVGFIALEVGLKIGLPLATALAETYVQERAKAREDRSGQDQAE